MKKFKLTILGIIALIGTMLIMPSCDVLLQMLTTPTNQVDDNTNNNTNNNNNGTTNTSKGKTQTPGGGIE